MSVLRKAGRRAIDAVGTFTGDRGETLLMLALLGYLPNIRRPRSFNEKVVARKLAPFPEVWVEYADKIAVRRHVADRIGAAYLTDLLMVTDRPDDLRDDALPDRFVVKGSHGSGLARLVEASTRPPIDALRTECQRWLQTRYGVATHEPWYTRIAPKILVEAFIRDDQFGVPLDYKCWVFHGKVAFIQVDFDRFTNHTRTFYSRDWERQPWTTFYPRGPALAKPSKLQEIIEVAEALAVDPDFVRVDLYCPNDARVVFGELTFTPEAGWGPFYPRSFDAEVGRLW